MNLHPLLIDLTAKTRKLNIPDDLHAWLLSEYGWEPCDNFWEPTELMEIIEQRLTEYRNGTLDITLPDEVSLWRERAETTKFILNGTIIENKELLGECERLMALLKEHGIDY